jgi:uncharacterized protein (TIGR00725 family)
VGGERPPYVAVIGAGEADGELYALAEGVGAELARRGAVLVCGGLLGVMEGACRGARSAGGTTIGILPGFAREEANPYVEIAIPTGMGELRNALVVRNGDVVIAVGGSYGTLSEIAYALKADKRVVGLRTWELARLGKADEAILIAGDPAEAVSLALDSLH